MKVSVIVPIYNSEKWIERCVNSILEQTYRNIELILIDDGSQDNSFEICNELAKKDNRIKLIHIENQGVANARNIGLENVCGDFITFCDSDDTYEKDFIEKLLNLYNESKSELCVSSIYVNQNGEKKIHNAPIVGIYKDISPIINGWFNIYFGGLWNKLYLTKIIKENNIKFPTDLSINEDSIFTLNYLKYVNSVNCSDNPIYNYIVENTNSLTRSFNECMLDACEKTIESLSELAKLNNCYDEEFINYCKYYYSNCLEKYVYSAFYNDISENKKKKIFNLLKLKKEERKILIRNKDINSIIIGTQPYFVLKIYFYLLKLRRKFLK